MLRSTLLALMGVSLAFADEKAFDRSSTVLMNVHKSPKGIVSHVKEDARHFHAKVLGAELNAAELRSLLDNVAKTKSKELDWYDYWNSPKPVTLVVEQAAFSELSHDDCISTAAWLDEQINTVALKYTPRMFSYWNDRSQTKTGTITVALGGDLPSSCVQTLLDAKRGAKEIWTYVALAPVHKEGDNHMYLNAKDNKKLQYVTMPYPKSEDAHTALQTLVGAAPPSARVLITDMPTDGAGLEARRIMREVNGLVNGRLMLSVDIALAPKPQPEPTPVDDDESDEKPESPKKDDEDEEEKKPEPIEPESDKDGKKKDDKEEEKSDKEEAVDPKPEPPKPQPKPEDDGAGARWFAGFVLVVVTATGLGGAFMHYRKQTAGGDASSYRAMV